MKKYLINKNTKEIHDLNNKKRGCKINEIKDIHKIYTDNINIYVKKGYNGCKWCLPDKNNG